MGLQRRVHATWVGLGGKALNWTEGGEGWANAPNVAQEEEKMRRWTCAVCIARSSVTVEACYIRGRRGI